jgi:hypothetical protein
MQFNRLPEAMDIKGMVLLELVLDWMITKRLQIINSRLGQFLRVTLLTSLVITWLKSKMPYLRHFVTVTYQVSAI